MMLSKLYGYLIAGVAALVAFFSLLYRATRQGRAEERAAQTERALEESRRANEIDRNVGRATDMELAERLHKHQRD